METPIELRDEHGILHGYFYPCSMRLESRRRAFTTSFELAPYVYAGIVERVTRAVMAALRRERLIAAKEHVCYTGERAG